MVAVTLLLSGVAKVRDLPGFVRGVREYHLLPEFLVRPLASLVPVVELTLGLLLLIGVAAPWPALGALMLFVVFAAAVAINIGRGRVIPCFCMGASAKETIGGATLLRLGLLGALAVIAIGHGPVGGGLTPPVTTLGQTFALASIVLNMCTGLALLGPGETLFHEVVGSVQAARRRKEREAASKQCGTIAVASTNGKVDLTLMQ